MIRRKRQNVSRLERLFLPLLLSSACLVVLLYALSQEVDARFGTLLPDSGKAEGDVGSDIGLLGYQIGVSTCEQTENLVLDLNPGFEQGIGCQNHWCCGGDCLYQEYHPGHESDTCARIFAGAIRDDNCSLFTPGEECILVEPGQFYDYSAWMKTDLLQGDAYLRIAFWSSDREYLGEARTTAVTDTQGAWVQVTGSVQAPSDAAYARIEATVPKSSVGSVWFDDIFMGLATCLDISKSDDPDEVKRGQMLTYTIVYSNVGRERATDVWVIETYDDYVDFDHADPDPWSGTKNIWRPPEDLPPGDSGTITVVVKVEDETGERCYLLNYVCITADELDEEKDEVPICITETTVISPCDGCDLGLIPDPDPDKAVEPGEAAIYNLLVSNLGACDGTVTVLTSSVGGWDVPIEPSEPFSLPAGESEIVTVSPTAPECARAWSGITTTITVTLNCDSPCDKTVTKTTAVTTTVKRVFGVDIEPPRLETALPCQTVLLTHTVSNTGNYTDTFSFKVYSEQGWKWSLLPPEPVMLGPCGSTNQSVDVTLNVTVPCTTSPGTLDTIIVTATSQGNSDACDPVVDQISVDSGCKLILSDPDPPQSLGLPGDVVTYTMTAWNAGTIDGVVSVTATSSLNWEIITPPTFTLPADNSTPTFVSLVVPPCTSYLSRNITSMTATLSCSSGSDVTTGSVTTTVDIGAVARIEPDHTRFVTSAGTVEDFIHTLTNIGNKDDTFNFETSSTREWDVDEPSSQFVSACHSAEIHLSVTIPPQAGHFSDTITIIAVPETQPSRSGVAFDWIKDGRVFLPLVMKTYGSPICNGDFETCDFTCWEHEGGDLGHDVVPCMTGHCSALLGSPDHNCWGGVPLGAAWMQQAFQVPSCENPQLSFRYKVHTQDKLEVDGISHDSFDVYLGEHRILRAGYRGDDYKCHNPVHIISDICTINLANPTDCNGTPINADFRGTNVVLKFENRTRYHEWYNTWTCIDDVKLTCTQ